MTILEHPDAQALLADATLDEAQLGRLAAALGPFLERYLPLFQRAEQRGHARRVLEGKLSALSRKTCEPIAHAAGVRREVLQDFVGAAPWDDDAVLAELRRHVTAAWADPAGVLTLDGPGVPKKGDPSCGVHRQWCGRLGKVENRQVGVFVGYACPSGHTLLDRRLDLPAGRAGDAARRATARVPAAVPFAEGWRIALGLLARCRAVPHGWVTADDEIGRVQAFRAELRRLGERYLVDVPCDTAVRDLEEPPPVQRRRRGSRPNAPLERVASWAARQPAGRWAVVEVRDGEAGPIRVGAMAVRVQTTRDGSRLGPEERLVVRRAADGALSYHLTNAGDAVGLAELVRARGEHHRVEECFREAKGEVGLGQYEVRSWVGWHHHMTLSLLALWFLGHSRWSLRGEKPGPDRERRAGGAEPGAGAARPHAGERPAGAKRDAPPQRGGADLPLGQAGGPLPAQTAHRAA